MLSLPAHRKAGRAQAHAELAVKGAPAGAHELTDEIGPSQERLPAAEGEAALANRADRALPLPLLRQRVDALPAREATRRPCRSSATTIERCSSERFSSRVHYYTGYTLARLEQVRREPKRSSRGKSSCFDNAVPGFVALMYSAAGTRRGGACRHEGLLDAAPTPRATDWPLRLWSNLREPARSEALARTPAEVRRQLEAAGTRARAVITSRASRPMARKSSLDHCTSEGHDAASGYRAVGALTSPAHPPLVVTGGRSRWALFW